MNIVDSLRELAEIVVDSASVPEPKNPQEAILLRLITMKRAAAVAQRDWSR